ncbi:hypothetical protein LNTAR_04201 [Lentisphaera araneosa HTCC2155]|uniref:Uncharacterized protein n=1 Tax=Lentisphaera araneosa HTCC2155 TaxID=313628 RepID=A6DTY6_9BACT|nr:hypothetical protein [Lentisphaera araneosa]EDM24902.1 hypothetical protein LNTAR_04201 [Lentisphaera araneosa HTCC2155]
MKTIIITIIFLINTLLLASDIDSSKEVKHVDEEIYEIEGDFYEKIRQIEHEYRKDFTKILLGADKVEIFIVKFDELKTINNNIDEEKFMKTLSNKQTEILQKKILSKDEINLVLTTLSKQIKSPENENHIDCHYPIHGMKIHKQDVLIFESTFCWFCSNFDFKYPIGNGTLQTTEEMERIFKKLLPIPQSEIDRFNKQFKKKK